MIEINTQQLVEFFVLSYERRHTTVWTLEDYTFSHRELVFINSLEKSIVYVNSYFKYFAVNKYLQLVYKTTTLVYIWLIDYISCNIYKCVIIHEDDIQIVKTKSLVIHSGCVKPIGFVEIQIIGIIRYIHEFKI